MADVVRVTAPDFTAAAATVAQHIETAATPPRVAVAPQHASSPVDAAAASAAGAIQAKVDKLSTQLAPTGPEIRQAGATAAASLTAQDALNSARLPSVPSVPTPSSPRIQAVDQKWRQGPSGDPTQNAYDKLKDAIREHNSRFPGVTSETAPAYNREADALNREKRELETKLGKSESPPARMSRLVPDWAQPPPEQPKSLSPPPPHRPLDITTPHARNLGEDPATGGRFRASEAETGLRVEAERGIDLVRSSHKGEDWVDVKTGKSYDAVGNFPAERLNLDSFFQSIRDHLKKTIDFIPVDVSQFTAEQRSAIRIFIDGLGDSRLFIVGDYGSGG